jgi:hypothetical protein
MNNFCITVEFVTIEENKAIDYVLIIPCIFERTYIDFN